MLAKCRGNLINGQRMIPQSDLSISIACSVTKYGYEWLTTLSIQPGTRNGGDRPRNNE